MSLQFLSVSVGNSDSLRLIRFFKFLAILGRIVMLVRVLIAATILGGILIVLLK
jgi:hypothetical protein